MTIWFWSLISLMTLTAWGFAGISFYKNSAALNHWGRAALVIFPVLAMGLYLLFGGSRQLQQFWDWQHQNAQVQQEMAKLHSPQQLIDRLRDHLKQDPNSAQGWYLLGKLYLDERRYADAESALTQAHQLNPRSDETVVALAKANFFNHQGHLTPAMEQLLIGVLKSLPEPVDAFNLLAVNAFRRQDYHQAVGYWQQALALVPPDSPDSRALLNMISQAQRQEQGENNGRIRR